MAPRGPHAGFVPTGVWCGHGTSSQRSDGFSKCGRASGGLIHPPGGTSQASRDQRGKVLSLTGRRGQASPGRGWLAGRLLCGARWLQPQSPAPGQSAGLPQSAGGIASCRCMSVVSLRARLPLQTLPQAVVTDENRPQWSRAEAAHGPRRGLFQERRCLFPPLPRKSYHFHSSAFTEISLTPVTSKIQLCP